MANRVVITGMGIVSCLGNDLETVADSLKNGRPGYEIDPERIDYKFRCPMTGTIKNFDSKNYLDRKKRKTMSDSTVWAYASALDAIKDSGLTEDLIQSTETGVIYGHDSVAKPSIDMYKELIEYKETKMLGSGYIFKMMNSTVTMNLSTLFKTQGANWSVAGACASGAHAIGQGFELIKNGHQERIIAGGAQEINWEIMASFDALGAFSTYIDDPLKASRPFDKTRTGLVPSGGAATIILESLENALKRGAKIYGEIIGYGFSADGDDMSSPNGIGAQVAMKKLLKSSGVKPDMIDYINAHATSTPAGDEKEAEAIYNVFGIKPYVSSTKSMTGHECWMAGASEIVYSMLMMRDNFVAPNINFTEGENFAAKINIVNKKTDAKLNYIVSNSFGFGGTNAALMIKRFDK